MRDQEYTQFWSDWTQSKYYGYDPAFGARPLNRLIQTRLLNPLALEIINGKIKDGQPIRATLNKERVSFEDQ